MNVNLDAGRVSLIFDDGPPYRGDIVTDLDPGAYWLRVDERSRLWRFEPGQVRSGLRFSVVLDGPDPFTLQYPERILLVAGHGVDNPHVSGLAELAKTVREMMHEAEGDSSRHLAAVTLLCQLDTVDLYDLIDELWAETPGVVNSLLLMMGPAFRGTDLEGLATVVRALESFARPPAEVYVDAFDSWQIHPDTFRRDEVREHAGLHTLQLVLTYELLPRRSIIVYGDDIHENSTRTDTLTRYGPGALTYPAAMTKGSTPRLCNAKLAANQEIERQNVEFFTEAFKQTATVLLSVYQSAQSIAKLAARPGGRGAPPATERGPGRWQATFEGGSNMSDVAERYELTSCGTPRGMGYYVEGVQFEGFANGKLLDAKFWQANGRVGGALMRGEPWSGWKALGQAQRQLRVAGARGVGVEWRVADPRVADALVGLFRVNNLPIRVVYIPPL